MCLVVPFRVVAVAPGVVSVRLGDRTADVFAEPELTAGLAVGDHVLVAGGVALRRLDRAQADAVSGAAAIAYGSGDPGAASAMSEEWP